MTMLDAKSFYSILVLNSILLSILSEESTTSTDRPLASRRLYIRPYVPIVTSVVEPQDGDHAGEIQLQKHTQTPTSFTRMCEGSTNDW